MPGCQEPGDLNDLRDKVKPYGRHVLVYTGRKNWMPELAEDKGFLGQMARDVKALSDVVKPKPKLTALATAASGHGVDVAVYPDGVVYRGVDAARWARIRDEHLRDGVLVSAFAPEDIGGRDVLVCVHGARDARCGGCGPLVAHALRAVIHARGLAGVRVHETSHVGGHKFAGNVIVYPGGAWYGYVTPADAAELVDVCLLNEGEWSSHLRGHGASLAPTEDAPT